jgi:hypothetical protein
MTWVSASWDDQEDGRVVRVPGWMGAFGALPLRSVGREFTSWIDLGKTMQVRARQGVSAAVVRLADGLWLVGDVPERELHRFGGDVIGVNLINEAAKGVATLVTAIADAGRRPEHRNQGSPGRVPRRAPPVVEDDEFVDDVRVEGWW